MKTLINRLLRRAPDQAATLPLDPVDAAQRIALDKRRLERELRAAGHSKREATRIASARYRNNADSAPPCAGVRSDDDA